MARMVRWRGILGGIALVGAGVAVLFIVSRSERGREELAGSPGHAIGVMVDGSSRASDPAAETKFEVDAVKVDTGSTTSKPGWMLRVLKVKDAKAVDVETSFADGTFVCTGNAEGAGALNSPPQINSLFLPLAASIAMVVEAHEKRVAQHLANRPSTSVKELRSFEDVQRVQDDMQAIKAAYRQRNGLAKEELERIAGVTGEGIERLLPAPQVGPSATPRSS